MMQQMNEGKAYCLLIAQGIDKLGQIIPTVLRPTVLPLCVKSELHHNCTPLKLKLKPYFGWYLNMMNMFYTSDSQNVLFLSRLSPFITILMPYFLLYGYWLGGTLVTLQHHFKMCIISSEQSCISLNCFIKKLNIWYSVYVINTVMIFVIYFCYSVKAKPDYTRHSETR